jgi:charged multivesicular body protein 2A
MGAKQSKPTLEEQLRSNKRMINRGIRELERERNALAAQEQKIINEIKNAAKKNQINSVKIMAKDLVRTRRYMSKFYEMKSHLQGVQLKMQTIKSTESMARSMASATAAMTALSKQLNLPALTDIMNQFQAETEKLGITQEVMGDTIDNVMAEVGDVENEEMVVNQVLDEIGIDANALLAAAPSNKISAGSQAAGARQKEAVAEGGINNKKNDNPPPQPPPSQPPPQGMGGPSASGGDATFNNLEARLNALKK